MVGLARPEPSWRKAFRENRWLVSIDFALVAAVFAADHAHLIWFSATPYLVVIGWASMAVRGVRWRDVGLTVDSAWPRLLLIGVVVGVGMEGLELFITQPLLVRVTGVYPNLHEFAAMVGNAKLLVLSVAFAWIVAGLGEELVWRGYLMNRLVDLTGRSHAGWLAALVIASFAFGAKHFVQGVTGVTENIVAGFLLGGLYLATGRNLLAPIVAHSVTDTLDFLIIYSGHYPGMH